MRAPFWTRFGIGKTLPANLDYGYDNGFWLKWADSTGADANFMRLNSSNKVEFGTAAIATDMTLDNDTVLNGANSSAVNVPLLKVDTSNNIQLGESVVKPLRKQVTLSLNLGAEMLSKAFFIAPAGCRVVGISEIHGTAETTAATGTAYVEKLTGTQAPGAGTALMTGTFNLKAVANTLQSATLTSTDPDAAAQNLAAGDRLGVVFAWTGVGITGADDLAAVTLTVYLAPAGDCLVVPVTISGNTRMADQHVFIADRDYIVTGVYYVHGTQCTTAASRVLPKVCNGSNQAPSAGTALISNNTNTGFNIAAANNTVQTGTLVAAATRLTAGNTVALDFSADVTALNNVCIVLVLQGVPNLLTLSHIEVPNALLADKAIFIADRDYEVVTASAIWVTASASGNVQLTRDTGTTAHGAGTDLLSMDTNAGWQADGAAAAVEVATWKDTRFNHIKAGDRLSLDFNVGANLVGFCVTVTLKPE